MIPIQPHGGENGMLWASAPPSPVKAEVRLPSPEDLPGTVFLVSSAGTVLKLPIPSNSPRDPLNWPLKKRIAALIALVFATSVNFFEVKLSTIMSITYQLDFAQQGVASSITENVNTFAFVMTAVGFPSGVALSTAVGRRPVLLASAFINTIATAVVGFLPGFGIFFIAVGGQGFTAGMILSMGLLVIVDATFIYERPWAAATLWCAVSILMHAYYPPISKFTNGGANWRPVYQWYVVPCLISFVLIFVAIPETFFVRPAVAFDGRLLVQSGSEDTHIYDSKDDDMSPSRDDFEPAGTPSESQGWLGRFSEDLNIQRAPGTSWRAAGSICVQMILCICNPLVIWSSLLGASILAVAIFQNETQLKFIIFNLLTTEPLPVQLYRADISFAVSGIVSALVSIPISAPLVTWFVRYRARRSGGVRHAEVYLIGYAIPIIFSILTICLFAASVIHKWPARVQFVIYGITNISYVLVIAAGIVWLIEAFPLWAAAAVAIEVFFVIQLGALLGAKLGSWALTTNNYIGPSILLGILVLVLGAVIVPVAFWGKNVRQFIHGRWGLSQKGALRPQ